MSKDRSGRFELFLKKDDMVLSPSSVDEKLKQFEGDYDWVEATSLKSKLKGMMKKKEIPSCPIILKMKGDGIDKVKKRYKEEFKKIKDKKTPNLEIVEKLKKQYTEKNVDPLATVLPPEEK
jgi:hypothetical protein